MKAVRLDPAQRRDLVAWRRDFHEHPELGFQETRTAGILETRLAEFGLSPRRIAGTGVVATIEGGRPGPTLMIRADMDALPVQEATGAPYASKHPGRMHA